ncbi:MAG TPA: ABC transporter permease [Gaiellaceae bacterium]|nr:ABC transporter permease [Gaiellaceae bacterium]HUJ54674.1 ABC transporter permease [Gaiellaceae bacterium]
MTAVAGMLERRPLEAKASRVRPARFLLPAYVWLVIAYTVVPIAVMVAYSFNQTPSGKTTFAWQGFTTTWYAQVFAISDLTSALEHSFEIATGSTIISLLLGVPLALALARYRWRGGVVADSVIFIDIAAPSVVVGASLLSFFITLNIARGLGTILIAHVAFNVAFVTVVVRARALGLDPAIEKAASDLGASPWTAFRTVTLPLLLPGIISGGLLAFAMSIDDFIITQFVAGPKLTFPLWIYGAVKTGIPPQVFVMGTMIFFGGVLIAIANTILQRRTQL